MSAAVKDCPAGGGDERAVAAAAGKFTPLGATSVSARPTSRDVRPRTDPGQEVPRAATSRGSREAASHGLRAAARQEGPSSASQARPFRVADRTCQSTRAPKMLALTLLLNHSSADIGSRVAYAVTALSSAGRRGEMRRAGRAARTALRAGVGTTA
jgi:hypothetical protein